MGTDHKKTADVLTSKPVITAGIVAGFLMLLVCFMLLLSSLQGGGAETAMSGKEGQGRDATEGRGKTVGEDRDGQGKGDRQQRPRTNNQSEQDGENERKTPAQSSESKNNQGQTPVTARPAEDAEETTSEETEEDIYVLKTGSVGSAGAARDGSGSDAPSFFGIWDKGQNIVYIIDRSGSMSDGRLANAKKELIKSLKEMDSDNLFSIAFYSDSYSVLPPESWIRAEPQRVRRAVKWVQQITISGGTRPVPAVKRALQMEPDAIFLLSDGEFSGGLLSDNQLSGDAVVHAITKANKPVHARIHTIGFGDVSDDTVLKAIARRNGGIYQSVDQ